ncbi:MAG: hypothetical protein O3B01_11780 [Planctomycetota bacterium]|nr:hypothetical protein [Planctomycetota bacterium]MDA1139255.1 hypothetical protein [Planctomycetota bacterium]
MTYRSFAVFTGLAVLFQQAVHAHTVAYYDLASLYHKSDVVVKAEALEFTNERSFKMGKIHVLESFKGVFKAGTDIQVSIKLEAKSHPDLPMVLFLIHQGQDTYMPLSTGIKFLKADEVLSYKLNHVPLLPERVAHWPESSRGQLKRPATEKEFWDDFRTAVEKVRTFEAARDTDNLEELVSLATSEMQLSQWNTDELSFEAAEILVQKHEPAIAFNAFKKGAALFLNTAMVFKMGFGTPERFDFLWQFVQEDSHEAEALLALELMSQNKASGYFRKEPVRERERLRKEFVESILLRATDIVSSSSSPQRIAGAAGVIQAWHEIPVELDSAPMKAIRKAIEPAANASVRHILIRHYCGLGRLAAYRNLFGDELYLVGDPPADSEVGSIPVLALHKTHWKIIEKTPVLTAVSSADGGLYAAVSDEAADARWKKLRETAGEFVEEIIVGNKWDKKLEPGKYLLRVRAEYVLGKEKKVWWSLPRSVEIE